MATKKETLEQSQKAIADFFKLSNYLFGDDAPMDVNEIPEGHEFYDLAKDLVEEMELDWNEMSHEDSNRVMLNMLADAFGQIKQDEDYRPVLTISFQKAE